MMVFMLFTLLIAADDAAVQVATVVLEEFLTHAFCGLYLIK